MARYVVMAGNRFDRPLIKSAMKARRFSHGSMFTNKCNREFVEVIGHTLSTGYLY